MAADSGCGSYAGGGGVLCQVLGDEVAMQWWISGMCWQCFGGDMVAMHAGTQGEFSGYERLAHQMA